MDELEQIKNSKNFGEFIRNYYGMPIAEINDDCIDCFDMQYVFNNFEHNDEFSKMLNSDFIKYLYAIENEQITNVKINEDHIENGHIYCPQTISFQRVSDNAYFEFDFVI